MNCPKCNSENEPNAKFCRSCGSPMQVAEPRKLNPFFNILFWISLVVFCYSLISVVFPIESEYYLGFGDEGQYHTRYSDPFGINADGPSYYIGEWMPVVIISGVVCGLSFYLRKSLGRRNKNKKTS